MERARWNAALDYDALAVGKVTGTNREVEAVVAASFAARTAASSFRM
jgi:hypothetical protein